MNSLYAVYEQRRSGFAGAIFRPCCAAGGTKHHKELLAPFGLDAADPGFWQLGLGVIAAMIDDIEKLEKDHG